MSTRRKVTLTQKDGNIDERERPPKRTSVILIPSGPVYSEKPSFESISRKKPKLNVKPLNVKFDKSRKFKPKLREDDILVSKFSENIHPVTLAPKLHGNSQGKKPTRNFLITSGTIKYAAVRLYTSSFLFVIKT